jgi:high-affinity iron transporter
MLANFLIGLREGMEAALIVGILASYLAKLGQGSRIKFLLWGVAAALLSSIAIGMILTVFVANAPHGINEFIAGLASFIAVVFVTWMIFWMARQSKNLSGSLRGRIDKVAESSGFALAGVAFFAVIREGAETSVFLWSSTRASGDGTNGILGAFLGLLTATVLGYFVYRGSLKIHLGKFFRYTGGFLILVAAGILVYGFAEWQEIGLLPFLTATTYDVSNIVTPDGILDILLRSTISFRSAPSQLESIAWFAYVIPTAWMFLKTSKPKVTKASA